MFRRNFLSTFHLILLAFRMLSFEANAAGDGVTEANAAGDGVTEANAAGDGVTEASAADCRYRKRDACHIGSGSITLSTESSSTTTTSRATSALWQKITVDKASVLDLQPDVVLTSSVCMNFDFGLFIDSPFVTK